MNIDCIILAAGLSSRMGSWKPVIEVEGKSLIRRAVENAEAACDRVIVVGGYRFNDLKSHLESHRSIMVIENKEFQRGMLSSVQAAIPYIRSDRFFITLGDMPYIEPEVYAIMSRHKPCQVLFPTYMGKKGHPVLIDRELKKKILEAGDDSRMRDILMEENVSTLEMDFPGIIADIDLPSDIVAN